MKKKLFVILLSLVMVVTMMPLSVFADITNANDSEITAVENDNDATTEDEIIDNSTDYLSFTAVNGDAELEMYNATGVSPKVSYEYSSNKDSWTDFVPGKTTISISVNQTIYFRAKIDGQDFPSDGHDNDLRFKIISDDGGKIVAGGNVMSLVSKECSGTKMQPYGFYSLFSGCTILTTAPELPATDMAKNCYESMFSGCKSLVTAPELPATELAENCYNGMFYGCKSLTGAPRLHAMTLAFECYDGMFRECTSLAQAPELPATKLAKYCYFSMFYGCTSLTKAPELPAKSLTRGCYIEMFAGCTSLTTAPELHATELAEECYDGMFYGCTKLNNVNVDFTSWTSGGELATSNWLYGVADKGTFTCPKELDTSKRDSTHVPAGWTIVKVGPPDIPAMKSLKVKATDSKTCQLSWDKLTQFDNVKYEIYRGTTPTGSWPKIDTVTGNSYTDKTVTSGTKYYYMLRPVVTVDGKEYKGPYSNKDYGYPRINALSGFRVWASDYKTTNISWNKCLDKDAEFWIYRGTKPTGDWGPVHAKVTEYSATSWSEDEDITPGTKYYYMVREAVKGNDGKYYFGPYTKADYAYPRLTAPSGFKAWASGKTTCNCSWNKLSGDGIEYLVYRGTKPTGSWGGAIGSTTDTSYSDTGMASGHKYYYMVRAKVTVNGKTYFGPYTKVDYAYPR